MICYGKSTFSFQAWKKTASYIRYHNWFSDTLELDWAAVNLRSFIGQIADQLTSPSQWKNHPLRLIPAPKSCVWEVNKNGNNWQPTKDITLRPLAHVNLRDQVVATALLLCLANRVETAQGDPTLQLNDKNTLQQVSSYGNRLFCENVGEQLHHRWGARKLYRSYFSDYRTFLSRSEFFANKVKVKNKKRHVYIVHADISKFYDRVRPKLLATAFQQIRQGNDDANFFDFADNFFSWTWHTRDRRDATEYSRSAKIKGFENIALPQGLVSAGFFANLVLLQFDRRLQGEIGKKIFQNIHLEDFSRYVDDLRVVVSSDGDDYDLEFLKTKVCVWLMRILETEAPELVLNEEKFDVIKFGIEEHPQFRQSEKMIRIQSAVSGGFDVTGGQEILDSIQALSQIALREESIQSSSRFAPLPDVRNETVLRFAAARFRTTYRSIRPLFEYRDDSADTSGNTTLGLPDFRDKEILDEDARVFAFSLIGRWVQDPSNMRLLRIGLDVLPNDETLQEILKLTRLFTDDNQNCPLERKVVWYCLSELFRAGATETGLVEDSECLPDNVCLTTYRKVLREEAIRLSQLPKDNIPWYLRQQILLFLAVYDPTAIKIIPKNTIPETKQYRKVLNYLCNESDKLSNMEFATMAVLSRRSFLDLTKAVDLAQENLTKTRMKELALRDPTFARELGDTPSGELNDLPTHMRNELCVGIPGEHSDIRNLADYVMKEGPLSKLRNELSLLKFALEFLRIYAERLQHKVILPVDVCLKSDSQNNFRKIVSLDSSKSNAVYSKSLYSIPEWVESKDRWRYQLGFLLRFILCGQPDFTRNVRQSHWKESRQTYRPAESHWYQRIYGLFSGQPAFGDDWVPISQWMENFLFALLRWPGCKANKDFKWVEDGTSEVIKAIKERIQLLKGKRGGRRGTLMMPMEMESLQTNSMTRPFRACVVQTVIPTDKHFDKCGDLTLSNQKIRRKHRDHLSAALAAVQAMLRLRKTHKQDQEFGLDLLVLPELAVHPRDVTTHLIPFARQNKTLILAGLTYDELFKGKPLINSALWIMPVWSDNYGWHIQTRRQGKLHLASNEISKSIQSFRPCQWLIRYPWSDNDEGLWLTASICYDATDLKLVAQLRDESDIFLIPALNTDVKTFDNLALALHYHMYQLVVVANNGEYGGSSAYWPLHGDHSKQIFHLHGQPQASIAFLEIGDIGSFLERQKTGLPEYKSGLVWKYPPAGYKRIE